MSVRLDPRRDGGDSDAGRVAVIRGPADVARRRTGRSVGWSRGRWRPRLSGVVRDRVLVTTARSHWAPSRAPVADRARGHLGTSICTWATQTDRRLLAPGRRRAAPRPSWRAQVARGGGRARRAGRRSRVTPIGLVGPNGPELAVAFLAVSSVAAAAPAQPGAAAGRAGLRDRRPPHAGRRRGRADRHPIEEEAGPSRCVRGRAGRRPCCAWTARRRSLSGPDRSRAFGGLDDGSTPSRARPGRRARAAHERHHGPAEDRAAVPGQPGRVGRPRWRASLALTPDDVGIEVMPLFHVHGLVAGLLAAAPRRLERWCARPGSTPPTATGWWRPVGGPRPPG